MNAIERASGDQRIMNTRMGREVNCRRCDPSSRLCHSAPSLVLIHATRVPSRENSVRPAMLISRKYGNELAGGGIVAAELALLVRAGEEDLTSRGGRAPGPESSADRR